MLLSAVYRCLHIIMNIIILAAVSRVEQRLYFVTCRATAVFCHVSSNGCILSRGDITHICGTQTVSSCCRVANASPNFKNVVVVFNFSSQDAQANLPSRPGRDFPSSHKKKRLWCDDRKRKQKKRRKRRNPAKGRT